MPTNEGELTRALGVAALVLGSTLLIDVSSTPNDLVVVIDVEPGASSQGIAIADLAAISGLPYPAAPTGTRPALDTAFPVPDSTAPVPRGLGRLAVQLRCVDPVTLRPADCLMDVRFGLQAAGQSTQFSPMTQDANATWWADCPAGTWVLVAGGSAPPRSPSAPAPVPLPPIVAATFDVAPDRVQGLQVVAALV